MTGPRHVTGPRRVSGPTVCQDGDTDVTAVTQAAAMLET